MVKLVSVSEGSLGRLCWRCSALQRVPAHVQNALQGLQHTCSASCLSGPITWLGGAVAEWLCAGTWGAGHQAGRLLQYGSMLGSAFQFISRLPDS